MIVTIVLKCWHVSFFQFFVASVCGLTASVVAIAYWIGLPYWWNKSPWVTVVLMIIGHWLLVNITFHYYMAANTHPGYPPEVICYEKSRNTFGMQISFSDLIFWDCVNTGMN
jgi:palmitoyltransferase